MPEPLRGYRIQTIEDTGPNRICWRCGTEFNGTHLIDTAPCADCRYFLMGEGDRTIWDVRVDRFKLPAPLRGQLVMKMIDEGHDPAAIAAHLDVHVRTVHRTIRRIQAEQEAEAA